MIFSGWRIIPIYCNYWINLILVYLATINIANITKRPAIVPLQQKLMMWQMFVPDITFQHIIPQSSNKAEGCRVSSCFISDTRSGNIFTNLSNRWDWLTWTLSSLYCISWWMISPATIAWCAFVDESATIPLLMLWSFSSFMNELWILIKLRSLLVFYLFLFICVGVASICCSLVTYFTLVKFCIHLFRGIHVGFNRSQTARPSTVKPPPWMRPPMDVLFLISVCFII